MMTAWMMATPAHAQGLGERFTRLAGGTTQPTQPTLNEPGYLGADVEPAIDGRIKGVRVLSVDPGSPAQGAGIQVGDIIFATVPTKGGILAKRIGLGSAAELDAHLAASASGTKHLYQIWRNGAFQNLTVTLAAPPPAPVIPPDPHAEAEAAFQQLCGSGAGKVSVATCKAMKRDLDQAKAQTGVAEAQKAVRDLCAPGNEKVSRATCTALRADVAAGGSPKPARAADAKSASSLGKAPGAVSQRAETPPGKAPPVPETKDVAPVRAPQNAPAIAAPARLAEAPVPVPVTGQAAPVPAHCRQQACWGGMDRNIGRSFSRLEITIPQTERVTFLWLQPGRVLRMEKNAGGTLINYDFVLNPQSGAPEGHTVLEDGTLATNAVGVEGAVRSVYRFVGDRFETEAEEYKRGRWRPWRYFGIRANTSFRSDQAIQQAREDRAQAFGTLMQGALVVGGAVVQAQADVNAQQAELNRLGALAAEETRQNQERAAAAQRAKENERARQVAEAQYAQSRQNATNQQASAVQKQAQAADEQARRQAAQRQADERAQTQARQEQEAQRQREAETKRAAEAQARAEQQRRELAERTARLAEQNAPIDWPESVTLCELTGDQARFGNWKCTGSLQWTYVNFDRPTWESTLLMTCSSKGPARDLGVAGVYRAYGCGYGVRKGGEGDIPARFGVFVGDRAIFRCPRSASSCRTR